MTNELVGAVVGGVIGGVAALVGAVLTFWLYRSRGTTQRAHITHRALTASRLEAAAVASALWSVGATSLPCVAEEEQVLLDLGKPEAIASGSELRFSCPTKEESSTP